MSDKRKSGGLGAFVRSALFEEDADKPSEEGSRPPPPSTARTTSSQPQVTLPESTALDPVFMRMLASGRGAAQDEFEQMMTSLSSVIPDDAMRTRAALAALAGKGIKADKVLYDIDASLRILDEDEKKDAETSAAAVKEHVGTRQKRMDEIDATVTKLQAEKADLQREVSAESTRIEATHRRYADAVAATRRVLTVERTLVEAASQK